MWIVDFVLRQKFYKPCKNVKRGRNNMATCRECLHFNICREFDEDFSEAELNNTDIKDVCGEFTPKSDYVKRERGEWIKHKSNPKVMDELHKLGIGKSMNRNSIFWTCSCCGSWGTPAHKFCPNCGADMRKEK